jgi:hypothetical protein
VKDVDERIAHLEAAFIFFKNFLTCWKKAFMEFKDAFTQNRE